MAFLKDKKAEIFKRHEMRDMMGGASVSYRSISPAPLWCYTRQLSQELIFTIRAHDMKEKRYFVFNYRDDVAVGDLVRYRDTWYEATRVDTQDDYRGDLFVYVKDCDDIPKHGEVMPYVDP